MLLVGIDGGDKRVIENMPMPFLQGLIRKSDVINVTEDLWSRGWTEILTGSHGADTNAFYSKFEKDYGYESRQGFSVNNLDKLKEITPLWRMVNDSRLSIGLMNFPTTSPVPSNVNGWMVSGAGAGISQKGIGGVPDNACSSPEIKRILDKNGYIFDIRLKASGIETIEEFTDSLIEMHTKRIDCFIELLDKMPVDIGALALMSLTRMQYLAMYEIESIIAGNQSTSETSTHINRLFGSFDSNIERLFKTLDINNFLIFSDHGTHLKKGTININEYLSQNEKLQYQSKYVRLGKKVWNKLCHEFDLDYKFKGLPIVQSKTKAFSGRYISGVFINDEERFGGPIMSKDVVKLASEIIDIINKDKRNIDFGISAQLYRSKFPDAKFQNNLPDIWIHAPVGWFFEEFGNYTEENKQLKPIPSNLAKVRYDQHTGVKGKSPILLASKGLIKNVDVPDETNLTITYKIIEAFIQDCESQ